MIELREYQKKAISELRKRMANGIKKFILCAPTGSGKTVMFSYMVKSAIERGKRVLIVTDRIELLTQAGGTLSKFGLQPVIINAGRPLKSFNGVLYIAMAQTLIRRIKKDEYIKLIGELDLIIFDESHKQAFNFLMDYISNNTFVIGATATPHREKNQISLDEFYSDIVEVVSIKELISLRFLSEPESYGVKVDLTGVKIKGGDYDDKSMGDKYNEIELYHGVYENYTRLTPNKKAIIFAPNVSSSKTLVEDFKEKGLPIEHLDGETNKKTRREILEWFENTPNAMISNVGILNAGFDSPGVEVIILYRATKSLPLFLQMCGRGSRVTETKSKFTILDFGNNIHRHGFWEQDRAWSLKKKIKKEGVAPVKDCPSCSAIIPASVMECKYCGHIFEPTEKQEKEKVIAELQKLSYQQIKDKVKTADFQELHDIAEAKGYKKTWIYYHLKTKSELIEYAKWKGYHENWVNYQIQMRQKETV